MLIFANFVYSCSHRFIKRTPPHLRCETFRFLKFTWCSGSRYPAGFLWVPAVVSLVCLMLLRLPLISHISRSFGDSFLWADLPWTTGTCTLSHARIFCPQGSCTLGWSYDSEATRFFAWVYRSKTGVFSSSACKAMAALRSFLLATVPLVGPHPLRWAGEDFFDRVRYNWTWWIIGLRKMSKKPAAKRYPFTAGIRWIPSLARKL